MLLNKMLADVRFIANWRWIFIDIIIAWKAPGYLSKQLGLKELNKRVGNSKQIYKI
jgi:hypothetical protein